MVAGPVRGLTRALVTLVSALTLAACTTSASPPSSTSSTVTSTSTGVTTTTTTTPRDTTTSTVVTVPQASAPPGLAECGPPFFSKPEQTTVTDSFGPNQFCLRWTNTWVVLVSPARSEYSSGGISRGGAVVLVDACQPGSAICLHRHDPHPLGAFTAYPAPDPTVGAMRVLYTVSANPTSRPAQNGALVLVNDNRCGFLIFDIPTHRWYLGDETNGYYLAKGDPADATEVRSAPSFPANQSPPPSPSAPPPECKSV